MKSTEMNMFQDNRISFRKVTTSEFNRAMELIEQGRTYLKMQEIDQWQQGYPDTACIMQDIKNGKGYFLSDGNDSLGYLCIDFDGEPAYETINGTWLTKSNEKYMVIHRLALDSKYRGNGLSILVFKLAEQMCREKGIHSIRVDTDEDNKIMQQVLKKAGFSFCGTIWFANSIKIAFEKEVF